MLKPESPPFWVFQCVLVSNYYPVSFYLQPISKILAVYYYLLSNAYHADDIRKEQLFYSDKMNCVLKRICPLEPETFFFNLCEMDASWKKMNRH